MLNIDGITLLKYYCLVEVFKFAESEFKDNKI